MKDTLLFLLTNIVDNPDDLVIDEKNEEGRVLFVIHANPSDMGKIIGRGGRIIRAIRDLVKLIATKKGLYADITLAEVDSAGQ